MNVYEIITDRIVSQLGKGCVPWRKPWQTTADGTFPVNAVTKRRYTGINVFMLWSSEFSDNRWATYKQFAGIGVEVNKGVHGTPVVFWKKLEIEDKDTGKKKSIPLLRYFTVFNVEQTNAVELGKLPGTIIPANDEHDEPAAIAAAEAIFKNMPNRPKVGKDGSGHGRAYYVPSEDIIHLPPKAAFGQGEEFYSTLFHELGHSTGHESRLARKDWVGGGFGSHDYGREELVAEMTAAFLSGESGIVDKTIENSAAYLNSWMNTIKEDTKAVVWAAGQAQRAADYILGRLKVEEVVSE